MSLNSMDFEILSHLFDGKTRSWEDFVDRFVGLVIHVIDNTTQNRGLTISKEEKDELAEFVFEKFFEQNFRILRNIDRRNHLPTYLTIVTRRIVVNVLMKKPVTLATVVAAA